MNRTTYEIRQANDALAAEKILRSLPEWFGIESAIVNYCEGVKTLPSYFVVRPDGSNIAFMTLKFHNQFTSEIHVMGVLKEFQSQGIGRLLVDKAEEIARERNSQYLMVKTLGPSHPDKNYARTREFYLNTGFCPLEEFRSIWDENNPCLILVKKI